MLKLVHSSTDTNYVSNGLNIISPVEYDSFCLSLLNFSYAMYFLRPKSRNNSISLVGMNVDAIFSHPVIGSNKISMLSESNIVPYFKNMISKCKFNNLFNDIPEFIRITITLTRIYFLAAWNIIGNAVLPSFRQWTYMVNMHFFKGYETPRVKTFSSESNVNSLPEKRVYCRDFFVNIHFFIIHRITKIAFWVKLGVQLLRIKVNRKEDAIPPLPKESGILAQN